MGDLAATQELLIDEAILDDGGYQRTYLRSPEEGTGVVLIDDETLATLFPAHVVASVVKRYGHPLNESIVMDQPRLSLDDERSIQMLMFRAKVDVDPRQYIVLTEAQSATTHIAALSRVVAGALRYLALH